MARSRWRHFDPVKRSLGQRWRERGGRMVRIVLPFDDVMEFALALPALTPVELEALGWTFADRKRLLDHFLASGKTVQGRKVEGMARMPVKLAVPRRDVDRTGTRRRFSTGARPTLPTFDCRVTWDWSVRASHALRTDLRARIAMPCPRQERRAIRSLPGFRLTFGSAVAAFT